MSLRIRRLTARAGSLGSQRILVRAAVADKRVEKALTEKKGFTGPREWIRPQVRRISAGSAEDGAASSPDGGSEPS